MSRPAIVCAVCQAEFMPAPLGRTPVVCSALCRSRRRPKAEKAAYWLGYYAEHGVRLRESNNARRRKPPITPRSCLGCQQTFTPGHRDGRYCSRECWRGAHRPQVNSQAATRRRVQTRRRQASLPIRPCEVCGRPFKPRRRSAARYCSENCTKRLWGQRHPDVVRRVRLTRRAREAGAFEEVIDPMLVFDRAGWRCEICGCSTPKGLRGKPRPNAPTVDHIVPIARGGKHAYVNVQLACLRCNVRKHTKTQGQLRLI